MTEILTAFRAEYEIEAEASSSANVTAFDFSAPGLAGLAPAVEIRVTTSAGSEWHGRFFGGSVGMSVVLNGPASGTLLVIASGIGYLVPAEAPLEYRTIPFEPIRSVLVSATLQIVCLVGFTGLIAIDRHGAVAWETRDLVSDGFTDALVAGSTLVVRGYVAPEARTVATTLDLVSGDVIDRD